jgi:hypothetical protein
MWCDYRDISRKALWLAGAGVVSSLLFGCAISRGRPVPSLSAYTPNNVYRAAAFIPSHIRRVAVLPISAAAEDWQASEGRGPLEPILKSEIGKTKAFEQVVVTPEQLKTWTGRESWLPEDELPADFFKKLEQETGCNAVLFTRLHPFHAYRPVVMGWEMKLVDVENVQIVWAVDEVFDAGEPAVAFAAIEYFHAHGETGVDRGSESSAVLGSPRRFSAYTLAALLATLPKPGQ